MSVHDPIKDAFEEAKLDFLKSLKDPDAYNFYQFTSINDVYDTTIKIQQEQNKSGTGKRPQQNQTIFGLLEPVFWCNRDIHPSETRSALS